MDYGKKIHIYIYAEISHLCFQVFLSTRTGAWVYNRVGEYGCPIDIKISSRCFR